MTVESQLTRTSLRIDHASCQPHFRNLSADQWHMDTIPERDICLRSLENYFYWHRQAKTGPCKFVDSTFHRSDAERNRKPLITETGNEDQRTAQGLADHSTTNLQSVSNAKIRGNSDPLHTRTRGTIDRRSFAVGKSVLCSLPCPCLLPNSITRNTITPHRKHHQSYDIHQCIIKVARLPSADQRHQILLPEPALLGTGLSVAETCSVF
jgi:hypothetical protein